MQLALDFENSTCAIIDCDRQRVRGVPSKKDRFHSRYCATHQHRMYRYGNSDTNNKTAKFPTYNAAHKRIRAAKGPARKYTCECGARADEWAYDLLDDDDIMSLEGKYICRYSAKPEHYIAMCVPCHRKFDSDNRRADAAEARPSASSHEWERFLDCFRLPALV